jgi:hypothetical protein
MAPQVLVSVDRAVRSHKLDLRRFLDVIDRVGSGAAGADAAEITPDQAMADINGDPKRAAISGSLRPNRRSVSLVCSPRPGAVACSRALDSMLLIGNPGTRMVPREGWDMETIIALAET